MLKCSHPISVGLGWLPVVVAVCACGQSSKPPAHAPTTTEERTEVTAATEEQPTTGSPCADDTCFTCGKAICYQGFFCDESSSVPLCQWVPTCRETPSCGCVEATLKDGCTCTQKGQSLFVKCSGS